MQFAMNIETWIVRLLYSDSMETLREKILLQSSFISNMDIPKNIDAKLCTRTSIISARHFTFCANFMKPNPGLLRAVFHLGRLGL
jgi:hypothetical protein